MNPIKLYEENKVMAGFSLLNLLFKQGGCGQVKTTVEKLLALYNEKKIKPLVDSLWALEEVRDAIVYVVLCLDSHHSSTSHNICSFACVLTRLTSYKSRLETVELRVIWL